MSYHLNQIRNLEKQANLQRNLAQVKVAESRVYQQKLQRQLYSDKQNYTPSRKKQDYQTSLHLKRSRLQAQLQASSVSTNAVLNRSRIQSALQVRQANEKLNIQRQLSYLQQKNLIEANYMTERQLMWQRQKERQLELIREQNIRNQIERSRYLQIEEKLYLDQKENELRRRAYQDEVFLYEQLKRPYLYY